jgi:hypothetical protein
MYVESPCKAGDFVEAHAVGANTSESITKRVIITLNLTHGVDAMELFGRVSQVEVDCERSNQPDCRPELGSI